MLIKNDNKAFKNLLDNQTYVLYNLIVTYTKEEKVVFRLTNDFAFKAVFAREEKECKEALMAFLNDILKLDEENKIKEITYLNPFNYKQFKEDKLSIVDVKVKTERQERINIEIQVSNRDNFIKRTLYYWSKLYGETISESKRYDTLKKCVIINILEYNLIKETNKCHSIFRIKETEENFELLEDFEIHFIELTKIKSEKPIHDLTIEETWIKLFKNSGIEGKEEEINKLAHKNQKISKVVEMMRKLSADEKMREEYLAREKAIMDYESSQYYIKTVLPKKAWEEGRQEGKEEGIKQGLEEGRKKGKKEGKKEGRREGKQKGIVEAAKKMLASGMDIKKVEEILGLTEKEIFEN